jgi:hypothetical protein
VIPFLIAVAVDYHLAIRFPVALLDDRCFAWLALALFDYGRSVAISVAMILTYRHCGSDRARRPQLPAPLGPSLFADACSITRKFDGVAGTTATIPVFDKLGHVAAECVALHGSAVPGPPAEAGPCSGNIYLGGTTSPRSQP